MKAGWIGYELLSPNATILPVPLFPTTPMTTTTTVVINVATAAAVTVTVTHTHSPQPQILESGRARPSHR